METPASAYLPPPLEMPQPRIYEPPDVTIYQTYYDDEEMVREVRLEISEIERDHLKLIIDRFTQALA